MGVDLALWTLNKKQKTFDKFSIQRRSGIWNEIRNMSSETVPKNLHEYEAFEFYDCDKIKLKRTSNTQESNIKKRKLENDYRKAQNEVGLLQDNYGETLRSIKAIYLKILILDGALIFEDVTGYHKEIFLKIPDDTNVVLYWF